MLILLTCRSQWPFSVRRGSAAARLLGLWVRIPPGAWMCVSCEWCVLSRIALCDGPILSPEDSYRLRCVWKWCEASIMRGCGTTGAVAQQGLWHNRGCDTTGAVAPWRRYSDVGQPNVVLTSYVKVLNKYLNVMYCTCWLELTLEMDHDKGKGAAVHPMKAYGGSRGMAPLINIGNRSTWLASFAAT
jgi:hypothetical protein